MEVLRTADEMRSWRANHGEVVGLVPTMGALHDGHLSLIRRACSENGCVVASVFVNPAQFDDASDLETYPRDLESDSRKLKAAGCDVLFAPTAGEMYPAGYQTWIDVEEVAKRNEGAHRPGHFRGVATVVLKLLHLVMPGRIYLGAKDAQQLAVIRRMVTDLMVQCEVVACPTVREADGLAMSSRNSGLRRSERAAAPTLYRALTEAARSWRAGEDRADVLRSIVSDVLATEPLIEPEYVSVADPATFAELEHVRTPALLSLAVRLGETRLIDNLFLEDPEIG